MIWITDAKALPDFRLWLHFSNDEKGEVDLSQFIANDSRPIVASLRSPEAFAAIKVELDTVVWANGFDLAPEFLYDRMKNSSPASFQDEPKA